MSSGGSRIALAALLAALASAGCGDAPAAPPAAAPAPAPVTPPAAVVQVPAAQASADASRNDVDSPPSIRDEDLPPLPETPFPAARPMEVVKAVYTFAARHPEVLSKVPCFCGCENRGH